MERKILNTETLIKKYVHFELFPYYFCDRDQVWISCIIMLGTAVIAFKYQNIWILIIGLLFLVFLSIGKTIGEIIVYNRLQAVRLRKISNKEYKIITAQIIDIKEKEKIFKEDEEWFCTIELNNGVGIQYVFSKDVNIGDSYYVLFMNNEVLDIFSEKEYVYTE